MTIKLLGLHSNTWNHLTVCQKNDLVLKCFLKKRLQIIYLIYMHKQYLALNTLQRLICHKTNLNRTITSDTYSSHTRIYILTYTPPRTHTHIYAMTSQMHIYSRKNTFTYMHSHILTHFICSYIQSHFTHLQQLTHRKAITSHTLIYTTTPVYLHMTSLSFSLQLTVTVFYFFLYLYINMCVSGLYIYMYIYI